MDSQVLINCICQNLTDIGVELPIPEEAKEAIQEAINCVYSHIIDSEWHARDVQEVITPSFSTAMLSLDDLKTILEWSEFNHDSCVGINWGVLQSNLENYVAWNKFDLDMRFYDLMFAEGVGL